MFVLMGAGCLSHKRVKPPAPGFIFSNPIPRDNCQDYEDSLRCPLNKREQDTI